MIKDKKIKDEDFLATLRERFKISMSESVGNRNLAIEDLKFVLGGDEQWDKEAITARAGRPRLTINKLPKFVRQVTGDQRQNRPDIKVRPVDSSSDPTMAKIIEGHIRNIQYNSYASIAYDNAFKHAVAGGYPGWWRVETKYAEDDTFDQDIMIEGILNQFCVYPDPETVHDVYRGGLEWCFVTETMSKSKFEQLFPKDEITGWTEQGTGENLDGWLLDDTIRVAEYYYKEIVEKTLYKLQDGSTIDSSKVKNEHIIPSPDGKGKSLMIQGQPYPILKERKVKAKQVKWCLVTGHKILEGPKDWAGKYIPLVPVYGDTWTIEGKTYYKSLIRDAKDAQKVYNYTVSQNMEMAALQPKVPYKVTPAQIKGHESQWNQLNNYPFPYVLYNPDPNTGGAPQREQGATVNTVFVQMAQQATSDMKDTIGIYDAALGQSSNERSGVAIFARQRESDVGMFEFIDNYGRAITFTGKILVDLVPRIYDTERTIRTLGEDDSHGIVPINKIVVNPDGSQTLINDITAGKYDIAITVGPSYTTQRMQAAESMMKLIQSVPQLMSVIGDLVIKNMDWPGSEKIAERLAPKDNGPDPEQQLQIQKLEEEIEALRIGKTKTGSEILLNLAKASAAEVGEQQEQYRLEMEALSQALEMQGQPPGGGQGTPSPSLGTPPKMEGNLPPELMGGMVPPQMQ